jgi:hypothetical protein
MVSKNLAQVIFGCVDEEIDENVLRWLGIGECAIADSDAFEITNIETVSFRTHDQNLEGLNRSPIYGFRFQ